MNRQSQHAPRHVDGDDAFAIDAGHPRRWPILAIVIAAESMLLLDGTIVNVAAPTIRRELGASSATLQWLAGAYALALAAGLLPGARLGDVHGRRRVLLLGTVCFGIASLLCGLAPSAGLLIACRAVQGLAAALTISQTIGIVDGAFPAVELPRAYGTFGPVMNLAAVAGPVLGGALVGADLLGSGWRLVFLVNLPLAAGVVWGVRRRVPESRAPGAPTLDLRGAALAAFAMVLLVFPLIQGREAHWPAWAFAMLAASAGLFAVLAWWVRRGERAGGHPLVTPSVLRRRGFAVGLPIVVLLAVMTLGLSLVLALYFQMGLGFSPLHASVSLAPWSLGAALGGALSAAVLAPRFGRRVLHAGLLVALGGALALIAVAHAEGRQLTTLALAGPIFVCGFGCGLVDAPLFAIMLGTLDGREAGSAGGLVNALFQLGAATGVAVLGTVFFSAALAPGLERVLWVEAGLLAATAALACGLPRMATPKDDQDAT